MNNELLSFKETVEELKVISPATLRAWVFQKRLPVIRLGSKLAFKREDIAALINAGYSAKTGGQ